MGGSAVILDVSNPGFFQQIVVAFRAMDKRIVEAMRRCGVPALQLALAMIFIWFGALKVSGGGPAEELVRRTVYWFRPEVFVPMLGLWEMLIGVCLLFRPLVRAGLMLLFVQLPGTFLPLVLLPEICFVRVPFSLTMEGQYIVKNLLIIASALVVGGSMRGRNEREAPSSSPSQMTREAA